MTDAGKTAAPGGILLQGFGRFAPVHVQAWTRLGMSDALHVADPFAEARERAHLAGIPGERISCDNAAFLDRCRIVDVVASSDRHFELCRAALEAGKDVFVEKPMTIVPEEAEALARLVAETGRTLAVGYYYRHHPIGIAIRERIAAGQLGRIRHVDAEFSSFKRPRVDASVLENDLVHMLDLVGWLLGDSVPTHLHAVTRDYLGTGWEDFVAVTAMYDGGAVVRFTSSHVMPGDAPDSVVPGAMSTKSIAVAGDKAQVRADFEAGRLSLFHARHEPGGDGLAARYAPTECPVLSVAGPVDVLERSLGDFLDCRASGRNPEADAERAGVRIANMIAMIRLSAREGRVVDCRDQVARKEERHASSAL